MAKKENDTETVGEELDLDAFLAEINTSPKLEEAQISTLEAFLDAQASMHMEMLDGYFCALICGPDAHAPDEYIPFIFSQRAPDYLSPEQEESVMSALHGHWQHIESVLKSRESYYIFLYSDTDFKVSANDWAFGFALGIERHRESWATLLEACQLEPNWLTPILDLYYEDTSSPDGMIPSDAREAKVAEIVENLPKIYRHFSETRGKKAETRQR